jgi:hypothetical protein
MCWNLMLFMTRSVTGWRFAGLADARVADGVVRGRVSGRRLALVSFVSCDTSVLMAVVSEVVCSLERISIVVSS